MTGNRLTAAVAAMLFAVLAVSCALTENTPDWTETDETVIADPAGMASTAENAPTWADVTLNSRGFLDEGEYVLEDAENGHWMYVNGTLRIQIVQTFETPEKIRKKDAEQTFNCFTTEIWCDTEAGELPMTLWADPAVPGNQNKTKTVADIAAEQGAVFAASTDLFTARVKEKRTGIVIRNGEVLYDGKSRHRAGSRPPYDTLAMYDDGHIDSFVPAEKRAAEYLAEGAVQVYTFGPVLVRNGEIPDEIARKYDRNLNPMHAFGMIAPGHYVDVMCEGRMKSLNGSTGVNMETMARIMKEKGCSIAVNLDGGDTAVIAFMGKQLNMVGKKINGKVTGTAGRQTCEVMAFGVK
jgi:exopolysaccharide biosynthesis protein